MTHVFVSNSNNEFIINLKVKTYNTGTYKVLKIKINILKLRHPLYR